MKRQAIIMAAGKGTRMNSDLPKGMHELCGKPMIECVIDELHAANVDEVVTILGYGKEVIEPYIQEKSMIATQMPQLGTAHAVMQVDQFKNHDGYTLVVNGDCPLITKETFEMMYQECEKHKMVVLTIKLEDPSMYGRVIRNEEGLVKKIVEAKDANEEEKLVNEINTGIYCFDNKTLFENIVKIKNDNKQNEYYITDMVELLISQGMSVAAAVTTNKEEVQGINNQKELAQANRTMQARINDLHMENGVCMIHPENTYIGFDVEIGRNTILYPNVILKGRTKIDTGSKILSNSYLENAIIGKNCTVDSSKICDSEIKDEVTVGPCSHLRMNTIVESKVRIGNFVEFKNTHFGFDSRCAHLTYLGDSDIGSKVNIGCGVVTVNYDGKHKYRTTVEDGAFIGSNANLIAPVHVGKNAVVAAGSTCNQDVEEGAMAIARLRQENKQGYGQKYKEKK
ncbi:MAG: bifunctional UDP-N-acetylglucosamine diphosphorylase/glucosamine-1-phosphate N-acetyltransferase GlmU [Erysipelotrichaceae bacterium]